jgi:hypothetical protein
MPQSGPGKIHLFNHFTGPEIPLAIAVAHTAAAGYYIGDYAIKGDTDTNDAGVLALGVAGGAVRLTTTDEDTKTVALTTDLVFSPTLNGPIVVEARVQMSALTAREIFIGICGTIADDLRSPLTFSAVTTITKTVSNYAGFYLSSELTAAGYWHSVYNGGDASGPTSTLGMDSGILAVAGEYDILRLVAHRDGRVEFWINGNREAFITGAVSTTTLQGVICGPFANDNTVCDLDVDYLLVDANTDWTR